MFEKIIHLIKPIICHDNQVNEYCTQIAVVGFFALGYFAMNIINSYYSNKTPIDMKVNYDDTINDNLTTDNSESNESNIKYHFSENSINSNKDDLTGTTIKNKLSDYSDTETHCNTDYSEY